MKKPGSKIEFAGERTAELMAAYRRMMREAGRIDLPELARRVVSMPCSRFWVSEERACEVVYHMQKGEALSAKMLPARRRMFEEINRRVTALRRERPEASIASIVSEVVNMPAPEFYMTPSTAVTTYYRQVRR